MSAYRKRGKCFAAENSPRLHHRKNPEVEAAIICRRFRIHLRIPGQKSLFHSVVEGVYVTTLTGTDKQWERMAKRDPYFAVLSDTAYLAKTLKPEAREEFFRSGERHVEHVLGEIRTHLASAFQPKRILDYGCGVGRLTIAFAKSDAAIVTGVDVSPTMLSHARTNCDGNGASVRLLGYEEMKSLTPGSFDLIHSYIVFQHIPIARGEGIFRELIDLLSDGGIGAIHLTFHNRRSVLRHGMDIVRKRVPMVHGLINIARGRPYSMCRGEMNAYSMNQVLNILYEKKCSNLRMEFSDHGTAIGVMLYFQKREAIPL